MSNSPNRARLELNRRPLVPAQPSSSQPDQDLEIMEQVSHISLHSPKSSSTTPKVSRTRFNIFNPFKESTFNNRRIQRPNLSTRKIHTFDETFRLKEKLQYQKLIMRNINTGNFNFKISEVTMKQLKPKPILIDLEKSYMIANKNKEKMPVARLTAHCLDLESTQSDENKLSVAPVNSLEKMLKTHPVTSSNIIEEIMTNHRLNMESKKRLAQQQAAKATLLGIENRKRFDEFLENRVKKTMRLTTPILAEIELEKEEEYVLPELTDEQMNLVERVWQRGSPDEVLTKKFDIIILRKDIHTLSRLNWLNDEVINFYMNLIMERSKNNDKLPKVYVFSTFFTSNLLNRGYQMVKRWTKKTDIFSYDLVIIPVHLGVHWCLAIIDFRCKVISYYDSMGSPNDKVLLQLRSYLQSESLDKKKVTYDTSSWELNNMADIPQQMNGSDCGMFACTFAEHVSRNAPLRFSQENMPYFRRKAVVEILQAKLIT